MCAQNTDIIAESLVGFHDPASGPCCTEATGGLESFHTAVKQVIADYRIKKDAVRCTPALVRASHSDTEMGCRHTRVKNTR